MTDVLVLEAAGIGLLLLAGVLLLGAHLAATHRAQQRRTRQLYDRDRR